MEFLFIYFLILALVERNNWYQYNNCPQHSNCHQQNNCPQQRVVYPLWVWFIIYFVIIGLPTCIGLLIEYLS